MLDKEKIELEQYIDKKELDRVERKNANTDYELKQQTNRWNSLIKLRNNAVGAIIGITLVILLVVSMADDRIDLDKDLEWIYQSTELTDKEKIESSSQLRKNLANDQKNILLQLLTLTLGFYFAGSTKNN